MNLPGRMGHLIVSRAVRAGAGNLTNPVGCAERRIARQRGMRSACDKDLPIRIARSMPGSEFKKTGAPSGNFTLRAGRRREGMRVWL